YSRAARVCSRTRHSPLPGRDKVALAVSEADEALRLKSVALERDFFDKLPRGRAREEEELVDDFVGVRCGPGRRKWRRDEGDVGLVDGYVHVHDGVVLR